MHLLKNRNKSGFVMPWILFPLFSLWGILISVLVCSLLGFLVVQLLSLKIKLSESNCEVEKYTWLFKKNDL